MKVTIKQLEYNEEFYINCPLCGEVSYIEYDDHILLYPLVCCWFCIESKYFIDCPIDQFTHLLSTYSKPFDLELLFIRRIANCHEIDYNQCNIKDILEYNGKIVNSYNIADIRKTYPSYNLDHDGIPIYVEVELKDGTLQQIQFSGD